MGMHSKVPKQQGEDRRDFDTTSLREGTHGRVVHRDYGAHFFRWGFATRMIKRGWRVLDVGCGADQALMMALQYRPTNIPSELVAVDYGRVKPRLSKKWFTLVPEFDFTRRWRELGHGTFDCACCLEVIEHMQPAHGRRLLRGLIGCLKPGGVCLLSTPVFDPKVGMAQNHIHEYGLEELEYEVLRAGFVVERRFGTFQTALQARRARPEHRAVWEELRAYYSDDVLACFLAPLYPDQSRNNMWIIRRPEE